MKIKKNPILKALYSWFNANKRLLPWRVHYKPYEVWISEMMLQQTQMERGVTYFNRWMERFPSVEDVANASEEEILHAWEGLGYYSRARNLHKAAKIICDEYNGIIPCDYEKVRELPGIGAYTAAAILGIAYEKDYATVDANVERVFSRLFDISDLKLNKIVSEKAQQLLPHGEARTYNQAWMEFGALLCKKVPLCPQCPLQGFCKSFENGVVNLRPSPKNKMETIEVFAVFAVIKHAEKGFLLRKRPSHGLWSNMWEFIGLDSFIIEHDFHDLKKQNPSAQNLESLTEKIDSKDKKNTADQVHKEISREILIKELTTYLQLTILSPEKNMDDFLPKLPCASVKHSYTNHRLRAFFYVCEVDFEIVLSENLLWTWDIEAYALASHHRKAAKICLSQ